MSLRAFMRSERWGSMESTQHCSPCLVYKTSCAVRVVVINFETSTDGKSPTVSIAPSTGTLSQRCGLVVAKFAIWPDLAFEKHVDGWLGMPVA